MENTPPARDLTRIMLTVICISMLIVSSFWIMRPFISSTLWATMIVIASWPFMELVQKRVWNSRPIAVLVMTTLLLLLLIIPFSFAIITIAEKSADISELFKSKNAVTLPMPPPWLDRLPIAGMKISEKWRHYASLPPEEVYARLAPYASKVAGWVLTQAGSVGVMIIHFLLTVIISAILYSKGERAAKGLLLFVKRLAGQQGEDVLLHAAKAVRGVALGIVGTALIQALLGGAGLLVTAVPATMLLTAVMFMLCLAQIGPWPVLIPAAVWLFWSGENFWGIGMVVWIIFVSTIDSFIRPVLIRKGVDLPLLLIFAGVIGGLIAFGVVGLFIGPVLLAVTYTLLEAWIAGGSAKESESQQP
jgi:predicted PurR-regulated permease PerM